ncbi:MAG: hypothetical protein HKN26_10045, partial [Acidimicrobiales bacterium]|nr:hypothetical protein [Acidimicrobiales bacterium]
MDSRSVAAEAGRGIIGATLDAPARFHLDALRWFITATEVAGVAPEDLLLAVVGPTDAEVPRALAAAGVQIVPVKAFDDRSPHCNKIAGARVVAARAPLGPVALTDLDLAFLADPRRASAGAGTIAGKTVDSTVPKLPVLDAVFEAAGLPVPPEVETSFTPVGPTRRGNFNGGLYVLDGVDVPGMVDGWERWARWLLERRELLDKWAIHVDQVSNLLALTELGLRPVLLDGAWNQATHKPDQLPPSAERPKVLHYHTAVDTIGRLQPAGHAA